MQSIRIVYCTGENAPRSKFLLSIKVFIRKKKNLHEFVVVFFFKLISASGPFEVFCDVTHEVSYGIEFSIGFPILFLWKKFIGFTEIARNHKKSTYFEI